MVFKEDLSALYFAFHDRLKEDGKEEKIIKCKICCLELPAYSTRSQVCEMCFDVDFWDYHQELSKEGTDIMWVIKVTKSGIIGNCYYAKGNYWAGRKDDSVASLGGAMHYKTKDKAQSMLEIIDCVPKLREERKEPPEFKVVQIRLTEV